MKSIRTESELQVGGRTLAVSNLNKIFYPKAGFTKGQVIDYYVRISKWLLPHLKDRPLTLKRYPNGVEAEFFYEKRCPVHRPKWLKTARIWSEGNQDNIDFCLANDLPSLVWTSNLGDLELHTFLSKKQNPLQPTMMVFDLDPGPPADILNCVRVSFWLREVFDRLGLKSLQVYVPLNTPMTYERTEPFAQQVAERLERQDPKLVVSKMAKSLRAGKVFIDWSQNVYYKTTVCVYSLRARERPTVSTPVTWPELEKINRSRNQEQLTFDSDAVLKRVEKLGDLFAPVLTLKQKLPKLEEAELVAAK